MTGWERQQAAADMNFQIALGIFYFFMLMVNCSWSWDVVNFRPVKSDNGEFLCGMSLPNKTQTAIKSKVLCMSSCFHVCPSPCLAANYWQNSKLCQHFYYIPCSYELEPECVNYQVTIVEFHMSKISAWEQALHMFLYITFHFSICSL